VRSCLAAAGEKVRIEAFSKDLEALGRVFHSKQLRRLGGEPLLHPQLIDLLTEARRICVADSLVLITNGVLLHKAPSELWELIDQLCISVYPGVSRRLDDEECARICNAHGVRLAITDYQTFQKTVINNRIDDPELVKVIFRDCKNASDWSCHAVHDGRFYKCSIAPFMGARLALRGIAFDNIPVDGVALHDNANLYEQIDRCLNGHAIGRLLVLPWNLGAIRGTSSAQPHRAFAVAGRGQQLGHRSGSSHLAASERRRPGLSVVACARQGSSSSWYGRRGSNPRSLTAEGLVILRHLPASI
jgi:hypothetical protein